jgi:hypothetical protein
MSGLLGKDLSANPCREMLAGRLCLPLSKYLKREMRFDAGNLPQVAGTGKWR